MTPGGFVLQPRDIAILRELSESRAIGSRHLACLLFHGSIGAAYKRLRSLCRANLICLIRTPAGYPDRVQLTHRGYRVLSDHEEPAFSWAEVQRRHRVSHTVLRHELAIMDVKSYLASGSPLGKLIHFLTHGTDRVLSHSMGLRNKRIDLPTPDAYIQLVDGDNHVNHFFLELDTGSQTHRVIENKIRKYRLAKLTNRSSSNRHLQGAASTKPFRLLFVCLTPQRREQLIHCLKNMRPPVRTFAIVTLLSDLEQGKLSQPPFSPNQ